MDKYEFAFNEWHEKTQWVQDDKRFDVVKPWGKHRADVLKEYIEHLEAQILELSVKLANVIALEKAQKLATQQGNIACALFDEVTSQHQRIAELEEIATDYGMNFQRAQDGLKKMTLMEPRTVTVKLPAAWWVKQGPQELLAYEKQMLLDALAAAGIQVIEGE